MERNPLQMIQKRFSLVLLVSFIFVVLLGGLMLYLFDSDDLFVEGESSRAQDMKKTACFSAESRGGCIDIDSGIVTRDECCREYGMCCP